MTFRWPGGLWKNPNFLKLWAGETISLFGSQITTLALPLTAAVTLQATPSQMGFLRSINLVPFILLTLFAGVWLDRTGERRKALIITNLGQGLLLGLIPLLTIIGHLRIEYLYTISFLVGSLNVIFQIAYQAYLPSLVDHDQLVEGNSKLHVSASGAGIAGPGLAGILIDLLTAPVAIALDALSFVVAAVGVALIQQPKVTSKFVSKRTSIWVDIGQGFRLLFANPYLRAILLESATFNAFGTAVDTLFVLYAVRVLNLGARAIGFLLAAEGVTWMLGAVIAGGLMRRLGVGRAMMLTYIVVCGASLLVPLAVGSYPVIVGILLIWKLISGIGLAMSNIQVISLRQAIIPANLFGRVNAAYRFLNGGSTPIGALLAGFLGDLIGLRAAMTVFCIGCLFALPWIIFSPVPALQEMPTPFAYDEDAI